MVRHLPRRLRTIACCLMAILCAIACTAVLSPSLPAADSPEDRKHVYVPLEDLDVVLSRDRRGVFLPREKYEELQAAAKANTKDRPSDAALEVTSVEYETRIDSKQLAVTARVRFSQFVPGWRVLRLPLGRLALERALLDDKPAQLARSGKNRQTLEVFSQTKGAHELQLEILAPLTPVGSDQVGSLNLLGGATASLSAAAPPGKRLLVGGLTLERPAPIEEPAVYEFPVGGMDNVALRFTDRERERTADSLLLATTRFGVRVSPGEIGWTASTSLQVFGRRIDRLVLRVPRTLEVTQVDSSGLESWELADDPNDASATRVTLNYRQPMSGSRSFVVQGIQATTPEEPWSVPTLRIEGASSHVGRVLIESPPGVRLRPDQREFAQPAAAADPPQATGNQRARLVFDAWQEDFHLAFVTETKSRRLLVSQSTLLSVGSAGLDLQSQFGIETLFAPLFEIPLELPADYDVVAVQVNGKPADWRRDNGPAGTRRLRVPLATPLEPSQQLKIALSAQRTPETWPLGTDEVLIDLPEVRLPEAGVLEGVYLIRGEADLSVVPAELSGLDPTMLDVRPETDATRLAYSYQDSRISGQLTVSRKKSLLASETLTFARLERETLALHLETTVTAPGGGVQQLRVGLSEEAGTDLQFGLRRGDGRIVEQTAAPPANGLRVWTVAFDRWLKGTIPLEVELRLPRGDAETISLPRLTVLDADRETGILVIEAAPEQQLTITAQTADGAPLDSIEQSEIPATTYRPQQRIVAAYRYIAPGWTLEITEKRFDREAIPTAVCHRAELDSVLSQSGALQHRALFKFSASGIQSLSVSLPKTGETAPRLWSAVIDGNPVEVRTTDGAFLVPVPAQKGDSLQHTLELFYATHVDGAAAGRRLVHEPPAVAAVSGDGVQQPVRILDQSWRVTYPDDLHLIESEGAFELQDDPEPVSLLGRLQQGFSQSTSRSLAESAIAVAVVVGVVGVFTLLYQRLGSIGIVTVLVFLFLLLIVWALLMPATQQAREAARSLETLDSAESMEGYDAANDAGDDAGVAPFEDAAPATRPKADAPSEPAAPDTEAPPPATKPTGAEGEGKAGEAQPTEEAGQESPFAEPDSAREEPEEAPGKTFLARSATRGARLSLTLDIQKPDNARTAHFQYHGTRTATSGVGLDVRYESEVAATTKRLLLLVLTACALWLLRKRPLRFRLVLAAIVLAVPLALVTLLPASWQVWLDGLFLGGFAGVVLWCARPLVRGLSFVWNSARRHLRETAARRAAALILAGLFLCPAALFAQDRGKQSAMQEQPATKKTAASPPRVVVPYDPETGPSAAKRVWLPYDEFLDLWNKTHPDDPRGIPQVEKGLVSEALYDAQLAEDGKRLAVTGRFTAHNLAEAQSVIALPLKRVALDSAKLDGGAAPLRTNPKSGAFELVLDEPGTHVLDVTFELPVQRAGPAGSFTLPLLPVASGTLSFALPDGAPAVSVVGGGIFRLRTVDGTTRAEIPIDAGGNVGVSWRPEASARDVDSIVHATSAGGLVLGDAGITYVSRVDLEAPQGSLNDVVFRLPDDFRLRSITGPDVGGWELAGEGDERTVRVFFRRKIDDRTTLTFDLFKKQTIETTPQTVPIPDVAPQGVTRDVGTMAVFADDRFAVRSETTENVTRIDTGTVSAELVKEHTRAPAVAAYRYISRPFSLAFEVARRTPKLIARADHNVEVLPRKQSIASYFEITLSESPRNRLSFQLPDEFLLTAIDATALEDWSVTSDELFGRVLTIELTQPRTGTVEVTFAGHAPRNPDTLEAQLTVPYPLEADRLDTQLAVRVDPVYGSEVSDAGDWRSLDPQQLSTRLKQAGGKIDFAFRSSETEPFPITLALQRAQPEIAAWSAAMVTVNDEMLGYALSLRWEIEQAAADTLTFTIPDWLSARLTLQADDLREVRKEPVDGGRVRWSVRLRFPQRGTVALNGSAALPITGNTAAAPAVVFEHGTDGEPLSRQRHDYVMINLSQFRVALRDESVVRTVRPEALAPIQLNTRLVEQAAAILRARRAGTAPSWSMQRFEQKETAGGAVELARIEQVLARDGTWRTLAAYWVRNRSRQFLPVVLPEDAEVLSVFVGNRPVRPAVTTRDKQRVHLVAIPVTSEADLDVVVQVAFSGQIGDGALPKDFALLARELELKAPRIVATNDDPKLGMPVARTLWSVYLPEDLNVRLIDDPDRTNMTEAVGDEFGEALGNLVERQQERLKTVYGNEQYSERMRARAAENARQLQERPEALLGEALEKQDERRRRDKPYSSLIDGLPGLGDLYARKKGISLQSKREAQQEQLSSNAELFFEGNRAALPPRRTRDAQARTAQSFRLEAGKDVAPGQPQQAADNVGRARLQQQTQRQILEQEQTLQQKQSGRADDAKAESPEGGGQKAVPPGTGVGGFLGTGGEGATAPVPGDAQTPAVWTKVGGLSLAVELPRHGTEHRFAKIGGDPKLALAVTPSRTQEFGLGLVWTIAWLAAGVVAIALVRRVTTAAALWQALPPLLFGLGLLAFFMLPRPISLLGFLALTVGTVGLALRRRGVKTSPKSV